MQDTAQGMMPEVDSREMVAGRGIPMNGTPELARPVPRPITIQPLNHGFHVQVGCQNFAVETVDALLHRLGVYLKNPQVAEKEWLTGQWKW